MDRIPEPELIDDPEQAAAYAAADFATSDQALVEAALDRFSREGLGTRLLDLGCGPGNISFRLATACPAATVLGLDGARAMLAIAWQRQADNPGRWGRLAFRLATLPLPGGSATGWEQPFAPPFSAVISNSLLHHLHDPGVLWGSLRQLAAAGAAVMVRDLRRPATASELESLVALHASTAPAVLQRDYALSLRAAFRADEVSAQLQTAGLRELTVHDVGDRYLEVVGRLD
jgi:SAM-dependent methyltransferase